MVPELQRGAFLNLSPFAGRGRIALAIRVRGEALRSTHPWNSRVGSGPSPQPSPRKDGAKKRACRVEMQQ
jgi:hypothetical protein